MKFVLVNGRKPRPQSFCNLCCEPIGETYLREIATRLCYCGHKCYLDRCKLCAPSSEARERLLTSLRLYSEARQAGKTPAWRSLPDANPVIDDDPVLVRWPEEAVSSFSASVDQHCIKDRRPMSITEVGAERKRYPIISGANQEQCK
jgi:hypothetical protein